MHLLLNTAAETCHYNGKDHHCHDGEAAGNQCKYLQLLVILQEDECVVGWHGGVSS